MPCQRVIRLPFKVVLIIQSLTWFQYNPTQMLPDSSVQLWRAVWKCTVLFRKNPFPFPTVWVPYSSILNLREDWVSEPEELTLTQLPVYLKPSLDPFLEQTFKGQINTGYNPRCLGCQVTLPGSLHNFPRKTQSYSIFSILSCIIILFLNWGVADLQC